MSQPIPELEALVGRFRAGEAEIAATFFAAARPLDQHLHWLRFQVVREARNLDEIANHERCAMVEKIEDSIPREDLVDQFLEDYQEIRHYAMLAYLYEDLAGEKVKWRALREAVQGAPWYELSRREHGKWAEYREKGSALEHAAALFTRGGGGALFYGLAAVGGGDYESLLSEASRTILQDELEHGASEGRDELYKVIEGEDDVRTAKAVIEEMCRLRLEMRDRQFSNVLSESRLDEIARGEIEPLTMDEMLAVRPGTGDWFAAYHAKPKPLSSASILR